MGLMLARVAGAMSSPTARITTGVAVGLPVATGTLLAAQYGNGDDFSRPTGIPSPLSWAGGAPGVIGAAGMITGGVLSQPGEFGRSAWKGGYGLAGASAAVIASTFLVTPVLRRHMSEN